MLKHRLQAVISIKKPSKQPFLSVLSHLLPLTHKTPHRERENGSERPETAQRPKSATIALITFILTVDASDLS